MNFLTKARELAFPKFNFYKPKEYHPDWDELNKEALQLALQIARRIELQKNFLQRTLFQKRKLLAVLQTAKNLLINKRKAAKNDHNFIPLFYIYTMTNSCNFLCNYCSNHRGGVYPELFRQGKNKDLTTEQSKQLIKKMSNIKVIYWCGGEPTIRKDLPVLLNYASSLNMFNMINTNGSLIGDQLLKPGYEKFLMQMDVIIISLDSLNVTQLAGMYKVKELVARKVLRNILTLRILRNYVPFKLVANTVITRDTVDECFDILNWINDLGITLAPVSANINENPDRELLNNPRYKELVDLIMQRANHGYPMIASPKLINKVLRAEDIQCYPVVFDHVDYDGKLFWPCKAYKKSPMINIMEYKNVIEAHEAAEKLINPFKFHGKGKNQCHGSCSWMQNVVTDAAGRAFIEGFFETGIFKEMKSLLMQ